MILGRTPLGLSLGEGELSLGLELLELGELCWLLRGALGIPVVLILVLTGALKQGLP